MTLNRSIHIYEVQRESLSLHQKETGRRCVEITWEWVFQRKTSSFCLFFFITFVCCFYSTFVFSHLIHLELNVLTLSGRTDGSSLIFLITARFSPAENFDIAEHAVTIITDVFCLSVHIFHQSIIIYVSDNPQVHPFYTLLMWPSETWTCMRQAWPMTDLSISLLLFSVCSVECARDRPTHWLCVLFFILCVAIWQAA